MKRVLNILSTNPKFLVKIIDKLLKRKIINKLAIEIIPKNKIKEFLIFWFDNSGTESLCLIKVVRIEIIAKRKIKEIIMRG